MFGTPKKEDTQLQDAIDRILVQMTQQDPDSEEYSKLLKSLERLNALKPPQRPKGISPDTKWAVIGNVVVALIIVGYERGNVLTSKAVMFMKPGSTPKAL